MTGEREPRTRWRCAAADCPAHRWQRLLVRDGRDPVDAACDEIEKHWRDKHREDADELERRAA